MLQAVQLPQTTSCFDEDLRAFMGTYADLWKTTSEETPSSGLIFTPIAQGNNESAASGLLESMEQEFRNYPAATSDQAAWRDRIFSCLRSFGKECFAFPDRHFDIIFSPEYFEVTRAFARQARAFDETIDAQSLAQALRNVWVMNCLQMFLGRRLTLTPSVFAYSMLYPFTDNYLDQPRLSRDAKFTICQRLGLRLSGRNLEPCDAHEEAVFQLIGMIEDEFPRPRFPEVFESLLAIHHGQIKSLMQQAKNCRLDDFELLRISVEKGGSSVLADGWLVAGKLEREEADFFFGFGVMLQLLDDLQDLPEDHTAGHTTLFTRAAESGKLDILTSRLSHFIDIVLTSGSCFRDLEALELRDLVLRNSRMLMMRAIADSADRFPDEFIRGIEKYSPMRFAFLKQQRGTAEKKFAKIWPSVAKQRKLRSIFDLLG